MENDEFRMKNVKVSGETGLESNPGFGRAELGEEGIAAEAEKPGLLLHICCAPDATVAIERLKGRFNLWGVFCNPNIEPDGEYDLREAEARMFTGLVGLNYEEISPDHDEWFDRVRDFPDEPERGERCRRCIAYRLERTARQARHYGLPYFSTTLSTSPHKDVDFIHQTGAAIAARHDLVYIPETFRRNDGYRRSVELSRIYQLYRQNYCGCRWSRRRG